MFPMLTLSMASLDLSLLALHKVTIIILHIYNNLLKIMISFFFFFFEMAQAFYEIAYLQINFNN